jgi:hypothetical protein
MLEAGAVSRQMSRNAIRKIVPPIHHRDTGAQRNIETTNPTKTTVVDRRRPRPLTHSFG